LRFPAAVQLNPAALRMETREDRAAETYNKPMRRTWMANDTAETHKNNEGA